MTQGAGQEAPFVTGMLGTVVREGCRLPTVVPVHRPASAHLDRPHHSCLRVVALVEVKSPLAGVVRDPVDREALHRIHTATPAIMPIQPNSINPLPPFRDTHARQIQPARRNPTSATRGQIAAPPPFTGRRTIRIRVADQNRVADQRHPSACPHMQSERERG